MPRVISLFAGFALAVGLFLFSVSPHTAFAQSENVVWLAHGSGDDVVQIPDLDMGVFLVARIHGNPFGSHFAVTSYDKLGNYTYLLANTTESYAGIVPFNFDAYDMTDVSEGILEIKAEGAWSIEVITLSTLVSAPSNQLIAGLGDFTGYVKGSSLTATIYGNEALSHFAVFAIGIDKDQGDGDLLVNTTSLYNGRVRLPSNKEGFVLIVKASDAWIMGFDKNDFDNTFDTRSVALQANPYSPFKGESAKPTATPTIAGSASTQPSVGTVNRDANLRSGPGTTYAIAGSAKNGDTVTIVGENADGSWLELADDKWVAAFLVDRKVDSSLTLVATPSVIKNAHLTPTATLANPSPASATALFTTTAISDTNLRTGPGIANNVAGTISTGDVLFVIGQNGAGDWLKLEDGNWIAASFVDEVPTSLPVLGAVSAPIRATPTVTPRVVATRAPVAIVTSVASSASLITPLAELNLEALVVQPGDLPIGVNAAQVLDVAPGMFDGMAIADQTLIQQLSVSDEQAGGIAIFLYESIFDANEAYRFIESGMSTNLEEVSSIGEKAIVTFMEKQVIKVQGNSLEVGSDSSDLLFSRCHAVVHIRISVDGLTKTKIEAYAKRLDKRLAPVVCGS